MEDLAQVTVYALYLWLAASLLWMWRSVLRNRRARKLAVDQAQSEGQSGETMTDQDEMMSTVSTESVSTPSTSASSNSTTSSNLDLRSDSASTNDTASTGAPASTIGSVSSNESAPKGVLAKANTELAMVSTAKQIDRDAPSGSPTEKPEESAKPAEKLPKTAADKDNSGHPATTRPGATPTTPQLDRPSTIADHLGGIRLPYDLLPMVPNGEKASDQRVSLVSDGAQPEVVGAAIADELERLGYSIKTLATDEAVAIRDGQILGLQIYPDASELGNDAGLRFPEAVAGSVAIDLWVKG